MPHKTINGTDIFYTDTGGDHPPVILLHSSAASCRQWAVLMDEMSDAFRMIAIDLIGYGQSDPFKGDHDLRLSDESHMVHDFLDTLGCPAHLVGHSYGGAVALHTALEAPENVISLGLYEPVSFFVLDEDDPGLIEIQGIAKQVDDFSAAGDYAAAMGCFVDYWNGAGTWSAVRPQTRAALTEVTPKLMHDFFAIMNETTTRDELAGLDIPTTIFCGSETRLPAQAVARALSTIMPRAELDEIAGAEHMSPVMRPPLVNGHIAAHLRRYG